MISTQIKLCTPKVPGQTVSLKTPACQYKPGAIRPRAAWSLRCWEQAAVQSLPGSSTAGGLAHAGLHCTLSTAWFSIYLLTLFSFSLKENFRGLVAATSGRATNGSQPGPGNRSQCGLILSSNNPVLGFSVGGLSFFLKLRWLLLPEP